MQLFIFQTCLPSISKCSCQIPLIEAKLWTMSSGYLNALIKFLKYFTFYVKSMNFYIEVCFNSYIDPEI